MDLWVVAAAAGAGYVAKNLQNLSSDKSSYIHSCNTQSEPRNFLQQLREKTCPLRRLARKRAQDGTFLDFENHPDVRFPEADSEAVAACTTAEETVNFEDGQNSDFSRVNRGNIIRGRRCSVHPAMPLNSFESQLCGELENNELDGSCLYPSLSTVRPFLAIDGNPVMSSSCSNSSFGQCEGCGEEERRLRENRGSCKVNDTMSMPSAGSLHSQGPPDSVLLFITGMTIGIWSATTSWKNEVDKLDRQLKQMENLVQDLHEELDMKEMVMVKDLTDVPREIQKPITSPYYEKPNKLMKSDGAKASERNREHLDLLSKIEAELQAELEMLENNMKAPTLEKISSVVEIDPDFELEIVQGDLKPVMANELSDSEDETDSENETYSATNSSQPASNYAVSPWKLSLKLHELIESRLEMRIKDLELALDNSQKLVHFLGSQSFVPGGKSSDHDGREDAPVEDNFSSSPKDPNGVSTREIYKDQEKEDGNHDSISHRSFAYNGDSESEDEVTDESEMLLIKQIVERSRSGSGFNFKFD